MRIYLFCFFTGFVNLVFTQNPGGVSDSRIWYKTTATTIETEVFEDFSTANKTILSQGTFENKLFNFNSSLGFTGDQELSFGYKLENLSVATIFMVYQFEEEENDSAYSLMHSDWNTEVSDHLNSDIENPRKFQYSTSVVKKIPFNDFSYTSTPNTFSFINSLLWFDFNTEKLYNSYGVTEESQIFVGKMYDTAGAFQGSIPEFIIFDKALGEKERLRVESYLAIKYGITLQSEVNYYSSIGEIIWHKENNLLFSNRIFGIGRDDNSGLHQKQSKSSNTDGESLVISISDIAISNTENENEIIEDGNFILIGDNNKSQIEIDTLNSGLRKIKRTWLLESFGNYVPLISTELHYNKEDLEFEEDEILWLLVDPTGTKDEESDFQGTEVVYYPMSEDTSLLGENYAMFETLKWNETESNYTQFTFALGPRMLINPVVRPMECDAETGHLDIEIIGGVSEYTIEIQGETTAYYTFLDAIEDQELTLYSLPEDVYTITVTDNTGYQQINTFEVSPLAGVLVDLGEDMRLASNETIILDASESITIEAVSYQWYKDDALISGATDFEYTVTESGIYKVEVTKEDNGCMVSDEIVITASRAKQISTFRIYPNPTESHQEFTINIELDEVSSLSVQIFDAIGRLINQENFEGSNTYKINRVLPTSGTYTVKIVTSHYTESKRIIIN